MNSYEEFDDKNKAKFDTEMERLNKQIGLIHLCLVYLSEDFIKLGKHGDALIRYLQSVFMKQVANPAYNPYAEYSSDIHAEANQVITIVGMFEERGEKKEKSV